MYAATRPQLPGDEARKAGVSGTGHVRAAIAQAGRDHAQVHVLDGRKLQPLPRSASSTCRRRRELVAIRVYTQRVDEAIEHVGDLPQQRLLVRHRDGVIDDEQQIQRARRRGTSV